MPTKVPNDARLLVVGRRLGDAGRGRELRERAGLSLRDAAELLGVNVSCLSRWERGKDRPSKATAIRWARLCADMEEALASTRRRRAS
jgi:transcriptional regulator with XRE-family HTH domain